MFLPILLPIVGIIVVIVAYIPYSREKRKFNALYKSAITNLKSNF